MLVSCSNCGAHFALGDEEIAELRDGVFRCGECGRLIKIVVCPDCRTSYSLTYTRPGREPYPFQCQRCSRSFDILFQTESGEAHVPEKKMNAFPANAESSSPMTEHIPLGSESDHEGEGASGNDQAPGDKPEQATRRGESAESGAAVMDIRLLLASCASAFTLPKLVIAALGASAVIAVFSLSDTLLDPDLWGGWGGGLRSLLSLIAPALSFSIYVLAASVIARLTAGEKTASKHGSLAGAFPLLSLHAPAVFSSSILLPLAVAVALLAFGAIPYVGPLLFALLFLPVYLLLLACLCIAVVGFWFLPPIIAEKPDGIAALRELYLFIKKQNFSLMLVLPVLTIASVLMFSGLWAIMAGSLALLIYLSKNILPEVGAGVLSLIPGRFFRFSTFMLGGADPAVFKDPSIEGSPENLIGGVIAGIVITLLFLVLSSSFISLCNALGAPSLFDAKGWERRRQIHSSCSCRACFADNCCVCG